MIEQRGRCKTCGTFEWQWNEGGELDVFDVDAYVCFGCERIDSEVARRKDNAPHPGLKLGFFAPVDHTVEDE